MLPNRPQNRKRLPVAATAAAVAVAVVVPLWLAALTLPARAQPGIAQPQTQLQLPEVVPPSTAAPAARDPVEGGLSVRRTLSDDGAGIDSQLLTLDFAAADSTGGPPSAASRGPFGQFWDTIVYWFDSLITGLTSGLTPPSPESFAKNIKSKDPSNLWRLVGDAGYKLKEITTDVGVVPDVAFKFGYVRELSDGDINWLERRLARNARTYHDPISVIQRMIIYTLLNINSSDVYFVSDLRVKLLPLPKAQFSLQPWDSGLSEEHDVLLRAIQGKKITQHKPAEEDVRY